MEFQHYFLSHGQKREDFFTFNETINGEQFKFWSVDGVFSKSKMDYGTSVLLKQLLKEDLSGKILDIGCGYGIIGIVLSKFKNCIVSFADVNNVAIELTEQNIKENKVNNVEKIYLTNVYEKIDEKFDYIVSNPPIKAGKEVLNNFIFGAKEHLKTGGKLFFVIKSKFGAKTLVKKMQEIYNAKVIDRSGGFFVVEAGV